MRMRERLLLFSSKDDRTVILTRQDFLPDCTADGDSFSHSQTIFYPFEEVFSLTFWLAARRLLAILSFARPSRDLESSFYSFSAVKLV